MKITREKLAELIEEAMCGMGAPVAMGMDARHADHGHDDDVVVMMPDQHGFEHKGTVSARDCVSAVMCMVECCSCPKTRAALIACCEDLMAGRY